MLGSIVANTATIFSDNSSKKKRVSVTILPLGQIYLFFWMNPLGAITPCAIKDNYMLTMWKDPFLFPKSVVSAGAIIAPLLLQFFLLYF